MTARFEGQLSRTAMRYVVINQEREARYRRVTLIMLLDGNSFSTCDRFGCSALPDI